MEVRLGFLARRVAAPVLLADLMGAGFVGRLLLSPLVAHNALVLAPRWTRLRFGHALLAAMFAAPRRQCGTGRCRFQNEVRKDEIQQDEIWHDHRNESRSPQGERVRPKKQRS